MTVPDALRNSLQATHNAQGELYQNFYLAIISRAVMDALGRAETKEKKQAKEFLLYTKEDGALYWFCQLAGITNPEAVTSFYKKQTRKRTLFQSRRIIGKKRKVNKNKK